MRTQPKLDIDARCDAMSLNNVLANVVVLTVLSGVLLPLNVARASEDSPTQAQADKDTIAKWIRQLDSNRFAERSEASSRLEAAGKVAFPALTEAALGNSREVTLRVIDILRRHFNEGDKATKDAAKAVLEKLTESDHQSAARRAKDVLNPKPPAQAGVLPGIQIGRAQIQIQMNAIAGGQGKKVKTKIINGVKEIEVEEKDVKIKITEDPAGGIKMEVTEKKDGKETTKKYSAKSADELKKNHLDAHKIYEKHKEGAGGIVQIQAIPGQPIQIAPQAIPINQGAIARTAHAAQLRAAQRLIEATAKQLKGDNAGETAKRLEEIAKQLAEIESDLKKGD